ncbi:MAG: hypothetical protein KDM91_08290 [Verrucomicrobiae bacterium]|nr:hypothetical protein [Verrucomicrobiae bacterium]MCP5539935.1 hypothetical protein [Akkermansiaceae bacterium]MCP5551369.1 hypothetical protein [Akkermansiaceae bacterium]
MDDRYLTNEPVFVAAPFSAADLDGKKLKWRLPSAAAEIEGAESSEILCTPGEDGTVSIALRDKVPGPHLDPDGKPIPIDVFGVWLTAEAVKLLKPSEGGADFEALA